MPFIKMQRSELKRLIESFLFEQEESNLIYVEDPNSPGYEYSYNKETEEISITKSTKKQSTTRDNPTAVSKDTNAYNAIKALFADQLKAKPEDKGKPVVDNTKLTIPFNRIANVHSLMEVALNEAITLTDPKIKDLLDKLSTGDQGIKDVITKSTQNGKFKFGYMVDDIEEKIASPKGGPTSQPLRKQRPFSYLAGKVGSQNKEIQKAYGLMTNGYTNLDGGAFVRLSEVTDAILDIYLGITKRSLDSLKSGKRRQQRKSKDEIATLESLIKAIENYKSDIKGYIEREAKAYSIIFDEITKAGNDDRAIELLKMQGFAGKAA